MINPTNFDCIFRPARPADRSAIYNILLEGWLETYGLHVSAESIRRFRDEDAVGEHLALFLDTMQVAVIDDEVVGVINQTEEFITALCVKRGLRGNGIGFCLLHNAYLAGGRLLEVAAFNERAIAFYRRHGWRTIRTYTEDVFGTMLPTLAMSRGLMPAFA